MVIRKKIILFLISVLFLANVNLLQAQEYENFLNWGENTKIYLLFLSRGYRVTVGSTLEDVDYLTNDEVLQQLQDTCEGVDFIVRDLTKRDTTTMESVLSELRGVKYGIHNGEDLEWAHMGKPIPELKGSKNGIDGVVIFGNPNPYSLAFSGQPTIVVWNLFEHIMDLPHMLFDKGKKEEGATMVGGPEYKGGKILTAEIDRRSACPPEVRQAMFDDIIYKIKLLRVMKQMKESRILVLRPVIHGRRDHTYLAHWDYQTSGNPHTYFPDDYNAIYTRELKEVFGTELVWVHEDEFYEAVKEADFKKAEELATKWIDQAIEMKYTTKSEVIKTAQAYLAFEALRKKYDCNAVLTFMRSLSRDGWDRGGDKREEDFWPGLGLMELQKRGIQVVCQDYPNVLVPHLIGFFLTGRPSMLGNQVLNPANNIEILTHCGGPVNVYGNEPFPEGQKFMKGYKPDSPTRCPYILWSHAESSVPPGAPGSSTGGQVFYPINVPVTVWKMDLLNKRFGFHTDTSVDGYAVYNDLDFDIWCRTKLCVKTDIEKVQSHYSPDIWGRHRAGIFADLSKELKDLAVLYGFKTVEENKDLPDY